MYKDDNFRLSFQGLPRGIELCDHSNEPQDVKNRQENDKILNISSFLASGVADLDREMWLSALVFLV